MAKPLGDFADTMETLLLGGLPPPALARLPAGLAAPASRGSGGRGPEAGHKAGTYCTNVPGIWFYIGNLCRSYIGGRKMLKLSHSALLNVVFYMG